MAQQSRAAGQKRALPKEARLKVRDLKALLSRLEEVNAKPDDTLIFAADERYVMLVRAVGGMHQSFDDELPLTEADREFLRALHIPF